jgi:hypothetical protein
MEEGMLTEKVDIWSKDPERKLREGTLVTGDDYLPILGVGGKMGGPCVYTTNELPANWQLRPLPGESEGVLLTAWNAIFDIQSRLAEAEREAEEEAKGG